VVTWDDHEVEDDYAGTSPKASSTTPDPGDFAARRGAAYQAWWENMPVRFDPLDGSELRIHRRVRWGRLADFVVLDTRQYRSAQRCPQDALTLLGPQCDAALTDDYTMLGTAQERWLDKQLEEVDAAWTVLVQGIPVMQMRIAPGNVSWNLDGWDGYPVARDRFLAALRESEAPNPVVLTGDVHSSWVGALAADFDDPASPPLGTEHVCPAVSSGPRFLRLAGALLDNGPHIRWGEAEHRGWVRHDVTTDEWRTEYRFVDDAAVPGSAVTTATRWVTPAGGSVMEA
jgi:alkaline phosphatase D